MAVLSRRMCLGGRAVALSDRGFSLTDIAMALSVKTGTLSKRSALLRDRFMEAANWSFLADRTERETPLNSSLPAAVEVVSGRTPC